MRVRNQALLTLSTSDDKDNNKPELSYSEGLKSCSTKPKSSNSKSTKTTITRSENTSQGRSGKIQRFYLSWNYNQIEKREGKQSTRADVIVKYIVRSLKRYLISQFQLESQINKSSDQVEQSYSLDELKAMTWRILKRLVTKEQTLFIGEDKLTDFVISISVCPRSKFYPSPEIRAAKKPFQALIKNYS